jgi:hypothetical protein
MPCVAKEGIAMIRDGEHSHDHGWVRVGNIDIKRVFRDTNIHQGQVRIPSAFHPLPDFRPASEAALADAMEGIAPNIGVVSRFDPSRGPFSDPNVKRTLWAQSLEFLRDINSVQHGKTELLGAWLQTWLAEAAQLNEPAVGFFAATQNDSTKTDRLIWRSRRILNCLSHALPNLDGFDAKVRHAFWAAIVDDIAKIGAPSDSLWSILKDGFNPLSPRAIWLRAVALLGVEAAFPNFILSDLVETSVEQVKASIQNDGLMQGGAIVGSLSAGADLCMLARIPAVEPVLHEIRTALASLRHRDGTLVTFGTGAVDYTKLLNAVIGPGDWKASALYLESGIARGSTSTVCVWMKSPLAGQNWGAICEIEVAGGALLTSAQAGRSAIKFTSPITVVQSRSKRRDEEQHLILESSSTFQVSGQLTGRSYTSLRQIRIARSGSTIEGEDIVRASSINQPIVVKEIWFAIPHDCTCYLSKDRQSVLIVTTQQQAWRFRVQGLDISVEMGSDTTQRKHRLGGRVFVICRCSDAEPKNDFRATWQFVLEDLV